MILSESEKNRIKGLYGLVTEGDSAPPPNESILVSNKNPFKYSEYESARRLYNKDLVDGDLFFKGVEVSGIWYSKIGKWLESQYYSLFSELDGKTLRLNSIDKIGTLVLYHHIGTYEVNNKSNTTVTYWFKSKDSKKEGKIRIQIDGNSSYESPYGGGEFNITDDLPKDLVNNIMNRFKKFKRYDEVYSLIEDFNSHPENEPYKRFDDHIDIMKMIPDNCFEIRKIQREKTDF
jgi:hypothetical protein